MVYELIDALESIENMDFESAKNFRAMNILSKDLYQNSNVTSDEAKILASLVKFDINQDISEDDFVRLIASFSKVACKIVKTLENADYPFEAMKASFVRMNLELED